MFERLRCAWEALWSKPKIVLTPRNPHMWTQWTEGRSNIDKHGYQSFHQRRHCLRCGLTQETLLSDGMWGLPECYKDGEEIKGYPPIPEPLPPMPAIPVKES